MDKSLQVASMYILSHIGLIFFFYPSNIIGSLEVGHWLAVMVGFLFHFAVIWAYTKGIGYFDRQNVMDIFSQAGKTIAIMLLLPITAYLLMSCIITVRAYAETIVLIFLSSTPLWATLALLLAISAYMALLGAEALFRTGVLMVCLCIPLILFVLGATFQHADWHYILPLADRETLSFSFLLSPSFLKSLFAFGGGFLFLGFIQPEIAYDSRKIWISSLLLLPLFLLSVYIPLLTFGRNTAAVFTFPFVVTTDTIDINWLMFDRISMFFMLGLIAFVMLFLALLLWKIARIVRFVAPVSAKVVIPILVPLIFVVCLRIPDRQMLEELLWWNTLLRLYVMIVIPAATLVLGILHKRKETRHA